MSDIICNIIIIPTLRIPFHNPTCTTDKLQKMKGNRHGV
jgi:hypothetical protein